jgi:hypothetical protein
MGKNVKKKKIDYGGMADEVISTGENESTDTLTPTVTDTQEQTPTPTPKKKKKSTRTDTTTRTPKYAPAHLPTMGKGERKTERLQLVVRPSTKSRLADYARDHGTSSNEVVQRLLDELLDESGY